MFNRTYPHYNITTTTPGGLPGACQEVFICKDKILDRSLGKRTDVLSYGSLTILFIKL